MRSPKSTRFGRLGQRVVQGVMDELDLVGAERVDGVLHLAGETEVLDEREHLPDEDCRDDAQPGDDDEPVERPRLGSLTAAADDRDGEEEIGERDLPWRRSLDLLGARWWSVGSATTGRARRAGSQRRGRRRRACRTGTTSGELR